LTRKKPKTIDELFHELEEYIMSDEDHRRRVAERNEARQGNREMMWRPQFQNPQNINNVKNPQSNQNNRPSTRGGFAPRKRGKGKGPQSSQTITQEILTSTANITEEVIAQKGAQNQEEHC
jgi:NCAIR mutase (PurE)-related protein